MAPFPEDTTGSLEKARKRLYQPAAPAPVQELLSIPDAGTVPHAWEEKPLDALIAERPAGASAGGGKRQVRAANVFFVGAFLFFLVAVGLSLSVFYMGGNAISVDKVVVAVQGPTTIASGDSVPLAITITNANAVAVQNATLEIEFPSSTRDASDVLKPYSRYSEELGILESGAQSTRSVKAALFGGAGQTVTLPISVSYSAAGSNAVFVKKATYAVTISTTPLSVTVDTIAEAVSGQTMTLALAVRSNANVPLENVVLNSLLPFGFLVKSSSLPLLNSSFLIGKLEPGASKEITLTGTLTGQEREQRLFRFTVGTAKSAQDQALAVPYMTQDASVTIVAPFIHTTLALNSDTAPNSVMKAGTVQNVSVAYTNTLPTNVTNATVSVSISGAAVDYNSIKTSNGFYRSSDHTIVFSRDTDPALALLVPNASGSGTFTFSTLPASALPPSPSITFTTSVSGTRTGQANVPEQVSSSATTVAKVATAVVFSAASLHSSGPFGTSGPIPPRAGQMTTYTVQWNARALGTALAGGVVKATLPSYVSYTGVSTDTSKFSYDTSSRTVTWNVGDLPAGATASGAFQVSLTPSTSQKGAAPTLTSPASFSGYDRFAGVQITNAADAVTTETKGDPGYIPANGTVQ